MQEALVKPYNFAHPLGNHDLGVVEYDLLGYTADIH